MLQLLQHALLLDIQRDGQTQAEDRHVVCWIGCSKVTHDTRSSLSSKPWYTTTTWYRLAAEPTMSCCGHGGCPTQQVKEPRSSRNTLIRSWFLEDMHTPGCFNPAMFFNSCTFLQRCIKPARSTWSRFEDAEDMVQEEPQSMTDLQCRLHA